MKIQIVRNEVKNEEGEYEDTYHVRLRDDDNGNIIFWTENYPDPRDADNAVEWLSNNAALHGDALLNVDLVDERSVREDDEVAD